MYRGRSQKLLANARPPASAAGVAAMVTVPSARGIVPFATLRGCFARRVVKVHAATMGTDVQARVINKKGIGMQEENLSILRSLKQNIEELIPPLEAAQKETHGEDTETVKDSLDLIMGELTMVVVMLTNIDSDISATELELINDMRHVVFGKEIPELTSDNYLGLFREFLQLYPDKRLTLDHVPSSIRLLQTYDQGHSTDYAVKAKSLFLQFAEAIVKADKEEDFGESISLANFKDILNAA